MTKKLSLVAAALLVTSSAAFAESKSIKEAFANGTTSGDITVYTNVVDTDGSAKAGFTAGSIGLNYETDSVNGFSVALGARAHHEFTEKEEMDYDNEFANDAVITVANIKYANDDFFASVGRQELDLAWLADYHEAAIVGLTALPDTTIIAGYTDRKAEIDETISEDFAEPSEDGAYVLDVNYAGLEGFEFNPYVYSAPDVADFYGLKVSYANDMFGLVAHYATSNEDSNKSGTANDGNILNLEVNGSIADVALALGYIKTDKDGGIGSMGAYGDSIEPSEEIGDQIYEADAQTIYASIGYEIGDLALGAQYIDVEYNSDNKDAKEWFLNAEYAITEELSVAAMYIDYEVDNVDSDKVTATVSYSF